MQLGLFLMLYLQGNQHYFYPLWVHVDIHLLLYLLSNAVHEDVKKNTGLALFGQQFKAMLLKRIIYTFRNKLLTISQIALPLIFTAITIGIIKTLPDTDGTAQKMPFNLDMYGETKVRHLAGCVADGLSFFLAAW